MGEAEGGLVDIRMDTLDRSVRRSCACVLVVAVMGNAEAADMDVVMECLPVEMAAPVQGI